MLLCPTVQRTSVGYVGRRGPRTSRSTTPVSALAASSLSIRNGTFNDQVFKIIKMCMVPFIDILLLKCIIPTRGKISLGKLENGRDYNKEITLQEGT